MVAKRLLDENVFPRTDTPQRDVKMAVDGGGNRDRVNRGIVDQLVDYGGCFDMRILRAGPSQTLRIEIGDSDEGAVTIRVEVAQEVRTPIPTADYADAKTRTFPRTRAIRRGKWSGAVRYGAVGRVTVGVGALGRGSGRTGGWRHVRAYCNSGSTFSQRRSNHLYPVIKISFFVSPVITRQNLPLRNWDHGPKPPDLRGCP